MADRSDPDKKWSPAPADFTLMHELVAEVRDLLGEACALLADHPVAVRQRHKPPAQFPRPKTAFDLAMAKRKREAEEAYDRKLEDFVSQAKENWRREQERLSREQQEQLADVDTGAPAGLGSDAPGDAGP